MYKRQIRTRVSRPTRRKEIPHSFVLDELVSVSPWTRPMFGCTSVYVEDKIVLILRSKETELQDNGVWLATTPEHHASLKEELPSMRSIQLFGPGPTGWQVLPEDSLDFEESVLHACQLILRSDVRIGKVPTKKKMKLRQDNRRIR